MEKTIYADEYRGLLTWLRDQRKQKGISMRDLGKALGVHHSWIGRIEQGERRLDIIEFARICRILGCNPHDGLMIVLLPENENQERKIAESHPSYRQSRRRKRCV